MTQVERVGFVGLGSIGQPMALNLCGEEHPWKEVVVFDLLEDALSPLVERGAIAAKSNREVGELCQVICVCVLDDAITEAVLCGDDGLLAGAKPGTVVAIHSTVKPSTVRTLAARAAERGVEVVDAQMTGGPAGAAARQLRFMVGGNAEALARCRPIFEAGAAEITDCGELGNGAVAKLCNNLVQYQAWLGYTEAHLLAQESGLSEDALLEVLSWIMNDNARAFLKGRSVLNENPDNEFLSKRLGDTMVLAEKDLANALDAGREVGISMPGTALCQQSVARLFGIPGTKRR